MRMRMNITNTSQVALLVDGDNLTGQSWGTLVEKSRKFGHLAVARVYMDFQTLNDGGLAARSAGFELMHILGKRSSDGYKSMVDVALATDAMAILYENPNITTFIIGTGDADFIPLIRQWKRRGKRIVVMANDAKLSGELRRIADEAVTFGGGKKRRSRSGGSRRLSRAKLEEIVIAVAGRTRLTDRETNQPLIRVDWLLEELQDSEPKVAEAIGEVDDLSSMLVDLPDFEPIDARKRTFLVGTSSVADVVEADGMSDAEIFELFAELCREVLPTDGTWMQAPAVFNEGKRLLEDGASRALPSSRTTGWFRSLMEDTSGVEVRVTDRGHMEFRRV